MTDLNERVYTGPKACEEWRCTRTAKPGSNLCVTHAKAELVTLRLTRKIILPASTHKALRHLDTRVGEPNIIDTTSDTARMREPGEE